MAQKKLLTAHGARFINPTDCGSTVAWHLEVTGREPDPGNKKDHLKGGYIFLRASVCLSDCSRRIEWDMEDTSNCGGIKKLDAAIAELQSLRKALVQAHKVIDKTREKYGLLKEENDE